MTLFIFLFFVVHILFHFDYPMDIAIDYVLFTFCIILFIDVKYKIFFLQQLWKAYLLFLSNSMSFHHWIKIQINQHELMLMCILNVVHKLQMTSSNLLSIKLGHLVKPKHMVWFSKFLLTKMGGLNFFA